ncbi:fimbrial protein [Pseudomonas caricapapayae]|jgi:major type 1 subunit fimbrin (pilin)|uniref:Fimbrial protein n=1 Tax=Pseudomonas caricapapayae TaxID=46678 RepID=A0ACC7M0A4_9PSED
MKKLSLATLLSVFASGGAFAASGGGTINFTGTINNDACTVDNANNDKSFAVDLGNVSIKDLQTNVEAGRRTPVDFKFDIHCSPGTAVKIQFDASSGSGSHAPSGALKLIPGTDAATGVAIAVLRDNGSVIDLNSSAGGEIKTDLSEAGSTTMGFSAGYVLTSTAEAAKPGRADATLPFILEYE